MDLDEWEILPSTHGLIDLHESGENSCDDRHPNSLIDMDYFQSLIDPASRKNFDSRVLPVVPIAFDREAGEIPVEVKEIPVDQSSGEQIKVDSQGFDQESVSQVFFKKLKEKNEFADMKMDSTKSVNKGFVPQIDVSAYEFEENDEKFDEKEQNSKIEEDEDEWEDGNDGLNIWKWAMSGIGALFSFGFAAATVSLIVLSNRNKEKQNKPEDLHFKFYSHDKRMKRVVHHATKLNEAINAVRGSPMATAHITIGGYCEGL